MFGKVRKIWASYASSLRRAVALDDIRRQFANSGYALDDVTDLELEAAITRGSSNDSGVENLAPLTGKAIYWTLRRISPDAEQLQMRKLKQPVRL